VVGFGTVVRLQYGSQLLVL